MRDVLVLCPQERDLAAIHAAKLERDYRIHFEGSDLDQLDGPDPHASSSAGSNTYPPSRSNHVATRP